jgi:hypothetical protein
MLAQINNPKLLDRWKKYILPHLRTPFLQRLLLQQPAWLNHDLIRQEISRRASLPQEQAGAPTARSYIDLTAFPGGRSETVLARSHLHYRVSREHRLAL